AVRIHQNLLARPDLPKSMHLQAHLALATDFQTGGLLDRALYQYQKALEIQSDHAGALEACLRIREQSSEWLAAEDLLSRLERVRNESYSSHRAYLFSEMARQCYQHKSPDEAHAYINQALELDKTCAPARIVEIELALEHHQDDVAETAILSLWQHAREHFPLVIPCLLQHASFYKTRGSSLLRNLWHEHHDAELMLTWIEALAHEHQVSEAEQCCDQMAFEPRSLRQSLRLHAVVGKDSDAHTHFARQWRKTARNFTCEQCGIEVVEVRWQCPQCHAWGTLHPKSEEKI
ncbi:MAG: heat-shock protein, partial [Mariprofundus sp.]|nr:heat-shock protein [Mariprofundus sp.]